MRSKLSYFDEHSYYEVYSIAITLIHPSIRSRITSNTKTNNKNSRNELADTYKAPPQKKLFSSATALLYGAPPQRLIDEAIL